MTGDTGRPASSCLNHDFGMLTGESKHDYTHFGFYPFDGPTIEADSKCWKE